MAAEDFVLWKIEFIWQLREFKNFLLHHFEFEEDSGFFDHFPIEQTVAGNFSNKIRVEHRRLIKDIDQILTRLRKTSLTNQSKISNIERKITKLIEDIIHHEESEMQVLRSLK